MIIPKVFFVLAALVLPVMWGFAVHRMFDFAEARLKSGRRPNDENYSDYQI